MVGISQDLLDRYAELRGDLSKTDSSAKIVEVALNQSIEELEAGGEGSSTRVKQEELAKSMSGESNLTPRERAELFEDSEDSEANLSESEASELQESIAKRVFGN